MRNSRLMFLLQIGIVLTCAMIISCQNSSNPVMPDSQQMTMNSPTQMGANATNRTSAGNSTVVATNATSSGANVKGSGSDMPAYYDHQLFTINFTELPPKGEQSTLNRNQSINIIYQCDSCSNFISVIDAIPTDGFNPLWQEVQITFNQGFTPHQFFSDDEIIAAANSGEITLTPTTEIYRCSVVGTP